MDKINWVTFFTSFLMSFGISFAISYFATRHVYDKVRKKNSEIIEKDAEIDRLRAELRWAKQDLAIQAKSISKLTAYKG